MKQFLHTCEKRITEDIQLKIHMRYLHLPEKVRLYWAIGSALRPDSKGATKADTNHEQVNTENPNVWLLLLDDSDITALVTTKTPLKVKKYS